MSSAHRTLAQCVVDYFAKNPEEELSTEDIAAKFDVPQRGIHSQLNLDLQLGKLARRRDNDGNWLYSAGTGQHPTEASAPTSGAPPAARQIARSDIHPDDVQIHKGIPIPRDKPQRGAWAARLLQMDVGDCTDPLPLGLTSTIRNAMKEATKQKAGSDYVLRRVDENGRIRVWRTS